MNYIEEPTTCPSCGYKLEKVQDQLFCRNVACTAQVNGKIIHFCKTLGIKGMGPKTVEKLQLGDITEIFYLDPADISELLGEKTATKLLDEIERSKTADFATVIESFSIPLVGKTAARKLATKVSRVEDITAKICEEAGLGPKLTLNLMSWLENEYEQLKEFLPFSFQPVTDVVTPGKTVCITGKLKSYKKKADAENDLKAAGYTLVDSVTKSLNYLVDEGNSESAKRKKAEQYGVIIITDLNDLLKDK